MDSIYVKDLCKSWGSFALDHLSFHVPQGCIVGLMGENGAGKSSTIRLLADALTPDAGEIRLLGGSPQDPAIKEQLGVVFDETGFHHVFTPKRVGKMLSGIYRTWDEALFQSYLERFHIPSEKAIGSLSKGTRQKLAIVSALAHRPKLLLLDEVTAGLDPVVRGELLDLFLEFIQDETHTILFSSHISSDVERIADYVILLHRGKVVLQAQKDALLYDCGIVRCSRADFAQLSPDDYLFARQTNTAMECLVADKAAFRRSHDHLLVDRVTLEELLLFYTKEEIS